MENPTSFDLNQALHHWRENLGRSPAFHGDNLAELESHLAESVAALQARGLSAEEAFWVATQRVGPDHRVAAEFAKINGGAVWLDRVLWMLVGIQLWGVVSNCLAAFAPALLALGLLGLNFDFNAHSPMVPMSLFALAEVLALAGSVGLCWWLLVGSGRGLFRWLAPRLQRRPMLVVLGVVLAVTLLVASSLPSAGLMFISSRVNPTTAGQIYMPMAAAGAFLHAFQIAGLLAMTLVLVRRRFLLQSA
jgi:hypothetical protein